MKSVKNNWQQHFKLNFKDNYINQISKIINNKGIVIFNEWTKVIFNNTSYEEKKTYNYDIEKNDSLYVFRTKYFFNHENSDLSYQETYDNGKFWSKKYFNQSEVKKKIFADYYTIDSILKKDYKVTKYHFENYPDHQNIRIEKDSVFIIHKENGKKVSEKLEYAGLPFREVFYDEQERIKEEIIYKNYQNTFNEWILWEERKYDGKGKVINRKFHNKSIYKIKDGILVYRKNLHRVRTHAMTCSVKRNYIFFNMQNYSPSILFGEKLNKSLTNNFDRYNIDENNVVIYVMLHFNANGMAEIRNDYSASIDVKKEFLRTPKIMTRSEKILKYFTALEVEAETVTGKKYKIDLSQNFDLLSFPIHTFLIKEEN
ncbi:hypothetical protein K0U91_04475 [Chryseobacterium chendengshani]|uniref:hypothetical protein n=1 Tax=Chryseobacterium sp. LJ668 TaxID=2864040 RepID=UPI001C69239A|nr:hypothetical protein [Chryseobacterium sp. LJ668]MBW8524832.1 hypothetical protein [Chryseobacterium sp. LJ668]QYK17391.1 hypothetical protein K0U91_04475 [Chryseobacterium sp. LJ668]